MDYEVRETAFTHPCVLCSPVEAYDAAEEAENARVRKLVQNMNLFDDDLMSRVFDQNIPATEYLLKTILERDDLHVLSVIGQHELKNGNPEGRNVRLDIHAALDNGEEFDVEVQRRDDGAGAGLCRPQSAAAAGILRIPGDGICLCPGTE